METVDGHIHTGLPVEETGKKLVLRNAANIDKPITIKIADIVERHSVTHSIMPTGQVNLLTDRRQFLDLVQYLIELRDAVKIYRWQKGAMPLLTWLTALGHPPALPWAYVAWELIFCGLLGGATAAYAVTYKRPAMLGLLPPLLAGTGLGVGVCVGRGTVTTSRTVSLPPGALTLSRYSLVS